MALNVVTFKTRALTALIFVAIMLTGLLWNTWTFLILFSFIHFGCWFEFQKLIRLIDPDYAGITPLHRYGVMIAGFCILLYCTQGMFLFGRLDLSQVGYWGGIVLLLVLPALEIIFVPRFQWKQLGYSALGLLYISFSLGTLTSLRCTYPGGVLDYINKLLVMIIIASIWINDTMAYIVGSLIGKTPLSPISPKKTWEGTLGGILLSVLVMGALGLYVASGFEWESIAQWMIIAAIAAVSGTFGDLLQSKLKRMAHVKDSGQIMPGHGGFLDRFDSLLVAAPLVWLYVILFLK